MGDNIYKYIIIGAVALVVLLLIIIVISSLVKKSKNKRKVIDKKKNSSANETVRLNRPANAASGPVKNPNPPRKAAEANRAVNNNPQRNFNRVAQGNHGAPVPPHGRAGGVTPVPAQNAAVPEKNVARDPAFSIDVNITYVHSTEIIK